METEISVPSVKVDTWYTSEKGKHGVNLPLSYCMNAIVILQIVLLFP